MKKFCLSVYLLLSVVVTNAQINWGDYSQSFNDELIAGPSEAGLILLIPKDNNSFWLNNGSSKHFETLLKDSSFKKSRPEESIARTTFDTSNVHFFLNGVTHENAKAYLFQVTEYPSMKILVPWHPITEFADSVVVKDSGLPMMAYLGGYKTTFGNMLIMDVKKKSIDQIAATSLIAWESIRPEIESVYTSENLDMFMKKLQYPWAKVDNERSKPNTDRPALPFINQNLILSLGADIYDKKQVEYEVNRDGDVFVPWKSNDYDNSFVWIKDYPPGEYLLRIRYAVQPDNITDYHFSVIPSWYQTTLFRTLASFLIGAFIGTIILIALFIRQKQRTREAVANKTKTQLELKTIYSQLNPHFVFNALSSIQGLINKQDISGANNYLSDFAKLMRESLNNSNRDEISLHEEIRTLETYLKLEQLRFGFQYKIEVDDNINIYDTNTPSLLLQPIIENAVKHGVSSLHERGIINLSIHRKDDSMIAVITDTGKGFAEESVSTGFGLKLTRDRIKLLNELNKNRHITFNISTSTGTVVTIVYKHWFL